jgi:hypothetical protein
MQDIDLVATAHNFLPFEDSYSFCIEPADMMITNSDITFSDSEPAVDQQITINATILNRGKTDFQDTVQVGFYIISPGGTDKVRIGDYQNITGLEQDAKKTVKVTWLTEPGDHTIIVMIDPDDEIYESYKWNNLAERTLYVRQSELFVKEEEIEFTLETNDYVGAKIQIKAKIHNSGDAPAKNVVVRFIDKTESNDEYKINDDKLISIIPINTPKIVTTTWTAVGGEHEIKVVIDPNSELKEFNKSNNSASKNITIKYPPIIMPLVDVNLDEDNNTINSTRLVFYIKDEDTSLLDLNISINSSDQNCVAVINQYLGIDIYPAPDWYGNSNLTITVDDGGVSVSRWFYVTVNPINDAPRFDTSNYSIIAQEETELVYEVKAYDPEKDDIEYSLDTELFSIDENTGIINLTPDQDLVNKSMIRFNVSLSDGKLTSRHQFEMVLIDVPDKPVVQSVPLQLGKVGEEFNLMVNAYDIDSENIYFYDNTSLFAIDTETGEISFVPVEDDEGTHEIEITVTDDTYESSKMNFILVINASDKNDTNGDIPENGDPDSENEDRNWFSNTNNLVILLAIILIIIIVLIFVLIRGRKKRKTSTVPGGIEQNFSDDYSKDTQSPDQQPDKEPDQQMDYDKEYEDLYSTPPPSYSVVQHSKSTTKSKSKSAKKSKSKGGKVEKDNLNNSSGKNKSKSKSKRKKMEGEDIESTPSFISDEEELLSETNELDFEEEELESGIDWEE